MEARFHEHIRLFAVAARSGSFRVAAEKAFVQPGRVGEAVQAIETKYGNGAKFFLRRSTGVTLTPEGEEFLELANPLLEAEAKFEADAAGLGCTSPEVRIGAMQGAWGLIIAEASSQLDSTVTLRPQVIDPFWPAQPVLDGHLEWALLPVASDHDPLFDRYPVFTEPRIVTTSVSSSIGHLEEATLAQIDAEPWMGAPEGADHVFTIGHRCEDLRGGPPAVLAPAVERPIDIGHALRAGDFVLASTRSVTGVFEGMYDGLADVLIADVPPWQIDLVTLREPCRPRRIDPIELRDAIRHAASLDDTAGLMPTYD